MRLNAKIRNTIMSQLTNPNTPVLGWLGISGKVRFADPNNGNPPNSSYKVYYNPNNGAFITNGDGIVETTSVQTNEAGPYYAWAYNNYPMYIKCTAIEAAAIINIIDIAAEGQVSMYPGYFASMGYLARYTGYFSANGVQKRFKYTLHQGYSTVYTLIELVD